MGIKTIIPFSGIKSAELVGIDISTSTIKLVCARSMAGRLEITKVACRNVAGASDDEIAKAVRSAYNDLKVKNPYCVNIIPSHMVITKNIEIPSTNQREIKEIVNLQAGRHTPYSREEIIVDYIDIGTYRRSYTKILLVIVARTAVKRHFQILDRAGIRLDKVIMSPEGVASACYKLLRTDTSILPCAVINVDESFTDFSIVFKEKVIFIRSIPIGAQALSVEPDKYMSRFAEEVKKSLEAYQNEDIERIPQNVIVTGAVQELSGIEQALTEAMRLPVKATPYLSNLTLSQEGMASFSQQKNVSLLGIVSCLSSYREMRVDLIPDEIKLRRAIEQRGRDLIKTGIFVLGIFLLVFFILLSKIHFKNAYLEALDKRLNSVSPQAQRLEGNLAKVNLIKGYLIKRGFSLEVLTELYNTVPLEIGLSDIRFDDQGKLAIKGTGSSMSSVFGFVDALDKSKYFKDVKTKYTTKRKEGLKDVTDFEINCLLGKGAQ